MKRYTVIDIGSSKTLCLIAGKGSQGRLEVYGTGVMEHRGLRNREFLKPSTLRDSILGALNQAQNEARYSPRSIAFGVPGPFIHTCCSRQEMTFESFQTIGKEDMYKLIEKSIQQQTRQGLQHISTTPVSYKLDGSLQEDMPEGLNARKVSGVFAHVFLREELKDMIEGILEETGIAVERYVSSTYAEGLLIVPEHRKHEVSIVLDIGFYHTDICIVRNQAPIYYRTILVGGAHIANDIAYVLKISPEEAELIKRRHVFGLDYTGRTDTYRTVDGETSVEGYETIQDVIEARVREMIAMVSSELDHAPIDISENVPIYLCGGGISMMRGGREFMQAETGFSVSTELPPMPRRNAANTVSAYAVLHDCMRTDEKGSGQAKENKWLQSIVNFFTQ